VTQRTYEVQGMSCEHCVAAVAAEVGEVPGVSEVDVRLDGGVVTVTGRDFDDDAVRSAVRTAGYDLV
jgi:copper chaperone